MPRSGSTWLTYILNTATEISHYFHEPFNPRFVPSSRSFYRKFIKADDEAEDNKKFCDSLLSGENIESQNPVRFSKQKRQTIDPLETILIKDVHASMMLEWFEANYNAKIITITRNPLNLAASWFKVWVNSMPNDRQEILLEKPIQNILKQQNLMDKYYRPYEDVIKEARGFWEQISVFWGIVYKLELEQAKLHNRIVIRHEDICQRPEGEFKELFNNLDLTWTEKTDKTLNETISSHSGNPYKPYRNTSNEVDKWKKSLEDWQVKKILKFTQPFGIDLYKDLYS